MESHDRAAPSSTTLLWVGRVASAIPVLMILFAATAKLMRVPAVVQGMVQYGIPASLVIPIGVIELTCTVVYLVPQTAVLGAILLTGLLGGAIFTNVRVGDRSFVLPLLFGVLVWAGLFLRDGRLRALIPLRT